MVIIFDEKEFTTDLDTLVAKQDRYDKPLIVMPSKKDVILAKKRYSDDKNFEHITFIDYPYFDSKKWLADDDYDHIDIFRLDQVIIKKAYGVPVGKATVKRVRAKKVKEDKQ